MLKIIVAKLNRNMNNCPLHVLEVVMFMGEIFDFLLRHWALTGALLIAFAAYMYFEMRDKVLGAVAVSPEKLVQMMNHEHARVVDLRTEAEFKEAHIINSTHAVSVADLEKLLAKPHYKNKKVVLVVPSTMQTTLSATLKKLQTSNGKTLEISVLQGGINAWRSAQLPLQKSKT